MKCNLCRGRSKLFFEFNNIKYYKCERCRSVFMDPENFLSPEEEKKRYEEHNNDVEDKNYQEFVTDIVCEIKKDWNIYAKGLDFGAGTGPVITKLLRDSGYNLEVYDPFFWDKEKHLNKKYDYIVSCEVIEHFHNPLKDFKILYSLLREGGSLYCKTEIYDDSIDFENWYYKNDPTHVFFYHEDGFKWIVDNVGFNNYKINDRIIVLKK